MEPDEKDQVRSKEAEAIDVADGAARVRPPRGVDEFPVVGIGASAGGLEAFTQLLKHVPPDTGMAFVLIQHLDPAHSSFLPEALAKATMRIDHEQRRPREKRSPQNGGAVA